MWKAPTEREDFIEAVKEAILRALRQFQKERKAEGENRKSNYTCLSPFDMRFRNSENDSTAGKPNPDVIAPKFETLREG